MLHSHFHSHFSLVHTHSLTPLYFAPHKAKLFFRCEFLSNLFFSSISLMDSYEASRTIFSRIQSLEPENASKIMGYLLIQDYGEKEMIRLAFGPETLLKNLILKAKTQLGLLTKPLSSPFTPSSPSPFNPISRPNLLSLSSSSSSSRIASNGFELSNPPTPSSNSWPLSPSSGPVLS